MAYYRPKPWRELQLPEGHVVLLGGARYLTLFSMEVGFWQLNPLPANFRLGAFVTGKDVPSGWPLLLAVAKEGTTAVTGFLCPCGSRFIPAAGPSGNQKE